MEENTIETRPVFVVAAFIREVLEEFPSISIGTVLNAGLHGMWDELLILFTQRGMKMPESKRSQIEAALKEFWIDLDPLMYLHPVKQDHVFSHLFEPSVTHTGNSTLWKWFCKEYPHLESYGKLVFYLTMADTFGPPISRMCGKAVDAGYFLAVKVNETVQE